MSTVLYKTSSTKMYTLKKCHKQHVYSAKLLLTYLGYLLTSPPWPVWTSMENIWVAVILLV